MLTEIINFFDHPVFIIVGGLTVVLSVIGILYKLLCVSFGISPIIFRLGIGLWKRKIAVWCNPETFCSLKDSLTDSLFKEKNIIHIRDENIDKAKEVTIFLVEWESFKNRIEEVYSARNSHQTPIVIYAKPGSIPVPVMEDIANRSNTIVVNFRGRLLNDLLTSLVTTSYDR